MLFSKEFCYKPMRVKKGYKPQEEEEEEDALSFCDLPIHTKDPSTPSIFSSSSEPENFFEFFTSGSSSNVSSYNPENIVFCGKLIPYEEPASQGEQNVQRKMRMFRWMPSALKGRSKSSAPNSSRWRMLMFGSTKLPKGMELEDIKRRQRRPRNPKAFIAMYEDEQRSRLERNDGEVKGLKRVVRSFSCSGYNSTRLLEV